MTIEHPPLPYTYDALEPHLSARTLEHHHGKHHATYVDKLNRLAEGTLYAKLPLEEIVPAAHGREDAIPIFNNAAQAWNHALYFQSLSPRGGGDLPAALVERIEASFGSVGELRSSFVAAATAQFGSGWAWLVDHGGALKIETTANAMTPLVTGGTPLLTCDVWEHAYYLDYQHRRAAYVESWWDHLVDWEAVAARL